MKKLLVMTWAAVTLFAGVCSAQEIDLEKLKGSDVLLRETVNNNRKVYVRKGEKQAYYIHDDSNVFPVRKEEPVKITGIEQKSGFTEVRFESRYLGKGKIKIYGAGDANLLGEAIRSAFILDPDKDSRNRYVLNTESGVVHFAGSNHLPSSDLQKFVSKSEVDSGNHDRCSLCFFRIPKVKGYDLEVRLSRSYSGFVAANYPIIDNVSSNKRLAEIGSRVLENWPMPLKGYNYRFYAVEGDSINAFASPAGRIYLTSAMLDALETDEEVEAVLAHEIAHVELRHGYRQFRSLRKAKFWGGLIAAVAGAYNKEAFELANLISNITTNIVLQGHSRKYESEADSMAFAYLEGVRDGAEHRSWLSVLKKLQYQQDFYNPEEDEDQTSLLASHPNIASRIDVIENSEMKLFPKGTVFQGLNSAGDIVATITFETQRVYSGRKNDDDVGLQVIATVETTSALGENDDIEKIKLITDKGTLDLDNKEDTQVFPNDAVGASFGSKSVRALVGEITDIKLDLRNVSRWERVPKQ